MATISLSGREESRGRAPWRAWWPAAALAVSFVPLLVLHVQEVWGRPHYQFVPLLLPAAAALVWQRCRALGPAGPGDKALALGLAAAAWVTLALGVLFVSPWLGAASALTAVVAGAYGVGGRALVLAVVPACLMLALALPPPRHLDFALVSWLQSVVSRNSGTLLDALKIDHVMEGNVVDLGTRRMFVDQACSGIYSLFTLLIGTLFLAFWTRASWVRTALLMASAAFWVVAGNVIRIVAVVVTTTRLGVDTTAGKKHEAIGLACFALMLMMVACTDRLIRFVASFGRLVRSTAVGTRRQWLKTGWRGLLLGRGDSEGRRAAHRTARGQKWRRAIKAEAERRGAAAGSDGPASAPPQRAASAPTPAPVSWRERFDPRRSWVASPVAALAFLPLFLPQLRLPGTDWAAVLSDREVEARGFGTLGEPALPADPAGFRRVSFSEVTRDHDLTWGENSRAWFYAGKNGVAQASLDYPFVSWHELTGCYEGQGWRVVKRRAVGGDAGPHVVADLVHNDGRHARLIFGIFDRKGRALIDPAQRGVFDVLADRLGSWGVGGDLAADTSGPTHQIQILAASPTPFADRPPAEAAAPGTDLDALYVAACKAVHEVPLAARARPAPARPSKAVPDTKTVTPAPTAVAAKGVAS